MRYVEITKRLILPLPGQAIFQRPTLTQSSRMNRGRRLVELLQWELAASRQKLLRVLCNAPHQHLKVQMRSGRTPGISNFGNFLPPFDQITSLYKRP